MSPISYQCYYGRMTELKADVWCVVRLGDWVFHRSGGAGLIEGVGTRRARGDDA